MKTFFAATLLMFASAGGVIAAPAEKTPAQVDAEILKACQKEGAKASECSCGLKIYKAEMTQRQLSLVPILYPIAKGQGDTFTKLSMGMTAAKAAGYTENEAMQAVLAVANNTDKVKQTCNAD